jgi:predicted ATP-dependent endonuclease of OLD family
VAYTWAGARSQNLLEHNSARISSRCASLTRAGCPQGRAGWNTALLNLGRFSGLDLAALLSAAGNHDLRQSLLDGPNRIMEEKLNRQWKQHRVTVRLSMNGDTLHVSAYDYGIGNYLPISARSEGLRQFVAITAFVDANRTSPGSPAPVLLLDEAEQHLHYDAQADLINVLVAQQDISKVIYTTHSAGCLPPDIGTGVRALEPHSSPGAPAGADPDLTRPVNNVWCR